MRYGTKNRNRCQSKTPQQLDTVSTGETVDYVSENQYNGFGQCVQKNKAYKATKYTKTAVSTAKRSKTVVKVVSKAKPVIVAKKTVRVKAKPRTTIKLNTIAASNAKQAKSHASRQELRYIQRKASRI